MNHPIPDELEAYALNHLGPANDRIIEEHLLVCEPCRSRLHRDDWVIYSIRSAFPNNDFTHTTEYGVVRVWIEPHFPGWAARISSRDFNSLRTVATAEKALALVSQNFCEAFPEHRCDAGCGTRSPEGPQAVPLVEYSVRARSSGG